MINIYHDLLEIVGLFSSERINNKDNLIEIGNSFYNIDKSLQKLWIELVNKSGLFTDDECNKYWNEFNRDTTQNHILKIYSYAEIDNKDKLHDLIQYRINNLILASVTEMPVDIARVIYEIYKTDYICTSLKPYVWYKYENNKWNKLKKDTIIVELHGIIMGDVLLEEYCKKISVYNKKAINEKDEDKDMYLVKSKYLQDIIFKLKDRKFRKKIIKECKYMFYNGEFEN